MSYRSGIGLEWKKIQKSLKIPWKKSSQRFFFTVFLWTNKKEQLFHRGFLSLDHLLFILLSFLNEWSYNIQHGPILKIFWRALKRSWILLWFSHWMNVKHWKRICLFFSFFAIVIWKCLFFFKLMLWSKHLTQINEILTQKTSNIVL